MKLPSFDDIDKVEPKPKKEQESTMLPSFDDLLNEFDSTDWSKDLDEQAEQTTDGEVDSPAEAKQASIDDIHESAQADINNSYEPVKEISKPKTLPGEGEIEDEVDSDEPEEFEDLKDPAFDDKFEDFKEIEEDEDLEDNFIDTDEEDYETEDEEDFDSEEDFAGGMGSLLPGMEPSDDIEIDDEPEEEPQTRMDSKDLDADEKAKEFFTGLKDKVLSVFNKKKKPKASKPSKPKKAKKDPNPSKPKRNKAKRNSPREDKKKVDLKNLDKGKLIQLGVFIAVILGIVLAYFLWSNSYSTIDELEAHVSFEDENYGEEVDIALNEFAIDGDNVEVTIANVGVISTNSSAYVTFKEKGVIPFMGDKIDCASDIINVEPDGEVREILTCDAGLNGDLKYKISVDIDNF